jgi:hypothetical protein
MILEELGHPLRGDVQDVGDVPPGQPGLLQLADRSHDDNLALLDVNVKPG